MLGKRAVNDGANPNWSARKGTNVGGDKPFIIEISFEMLFESSNVIAGSNDVSKEEYVRTVLLNQFRQTDKLFLLKTQ